MDKDHLKIFYDQEVVREAVKRFFYETMDEAVLEAAYKGEEVGGYKEAREVVRRAFSRLNEHYAKEEESSTDNKAR